MAFPPKLVVEQLTMMDVELFQKVVSSPCLGSTWGKRNKPGNEHQTPNVQATVDHVRRVASFVIIPCLGDPSKTAQDRVRVVERWIQVAQEFEILKNFFSSCTVNSALQKTFTSHLKNTRGKFPARTLLLLLSSPHLQGAASCLPQGCAWQRIPMAQVEKQAAHPQEGPSTFAPPESNPQRVQEKQQQRQGNGINLEKSTEEQLWHSLQGRGRRWKSETFWAEQSLASPAVSYIEWKSLIPEKWETHPIGGYTLSCQPER
ncbi:ral guanine nucleotide dissociation stimulator-like isoform X2 [Diceros bicornis minor]|uniref:ral guanine nucleotide dissociation stimulator-like isoform X2 n=1 Tax=Diceros bicornis minor TaxID=77932 RepID=UPI0026F2CA90|nr:ral guanine nucleotide dissociation stimulator-like isoform X2 [Diceros bicornis minor]